MDEIKYQIFVSSTYKDLIEAREKIIETILKLYHFPVGMEMFSADDDEQWEVIKDTIDISDYYVLPKLSDSGNRVNLGQDMEELNHTVWHELKKGRIWRES
jgi:hypothetical protein